MERLADVVEATAIRPFQVSIPEEIESKLHILLGSVTQEKLVESRNKYIQLNPKKFPTRKHRSHWR